MDSTLGGELSRQKKTIRSKTSKIGDRNLGAFGGASAEPIPTQRAKGAFRSSTALFSDAKVSG